MKIVRCTEDDLPVLTEFYSGVTEYLERTVNYPKWVTGVYPARESISRDIADGAQYICLRCGAAAGAFVLNSDPRGDYSSGDWKRPLEQGEYLVIHTLAVSPNMYGTGIGGHMVDYCIDKARSEGFRALRIDVVPDNTPARRLYEKAGFTFAGERDLHRGIPEIPLFALYEICF